MTAKTGHYLASLFLPLLLFFSNFNIEKLFETIPFLTDVSNFYKMSPLARLLYMAAHLWALIYPPFAHFSLVLVCLRFIVWYFSNETSREWFRRRGWNIPSTPASSDHPEILAALRQIEETLERSNDLSEERCELLRMIVDSLAELKRLTAENHVEIMGAQSELLMIYTDSLDTARALLSSLDTLGHDVHLLTFEVDRILWVFLQLV